MRIRLQKCTSRRSLHSNEQEVPQCNTIRIKNRAYCRCSDLLGAIQDNKRIIQGLTSQIFNLRTELSDRRTAKKNVWSTSPSANILPRKPFETVEDFLVFEKALKDFPEKHDDLKTAFMAYGDRIDPKKFVKNNLRKIFDDKVAREFSWRGTNAKRCARTLSTLVALRNAFEASHNKAEEFFDQAAMRHFKYANDRFKTKRTLEL